MLDILQSIIAAPKQFQNYIAGELRGAQDGSVIERESPAHGKVVSIYPKSNSADVEEAINAARASFDGGEWAFRYGGERAELLGKVAQMIRDDVEELALIETLETSKPLAVSRGEVLFRPACGTMPRPLREHSTAIATTIWGHK